MYVIFQMLFCVAIVIMIININKKFAVFKYNNSVYTRYYIIPCDERLLYIYVELWYKNKLKCFIFILNQMADTRFDIYFWEKYDMDKEFRGKLLKHTFYWKDEENWKWVWTWEKGETCRWHIRGRKGAVRQVWWSLCQSAILLRLWFTHRGWQELLCKL